MVLRMASVWTHPKTGVLWFRRAVPAKYRAVLGKWEIKRSLETKDRKFAQRRFLQVASDVSAELGALETWALDLPNCITISESHLNELKSRSFQ